MESPHRLFWAQTTHPLHTTFTCCCLTSPMSRLQKILASAALGLIAVVAGLAWWLGYFSDSPDAVNIDAASAAVGENTTVPTSGDTTVPTDTAGGDTTAPTDTAPTDTAPTDTAPTDTAPVDNIDGTWTVQPNEDGTFVGYRINEVLNSIGDFEVVGRTGDVTGSLEASGTTITAVDLVAQMSTLTTDNGGRDRQMRSQALETEEFPEATFVLTSLIEIGSIPAAGETLSVSALGDLTIHGVTQAVEFPLQARVVSGSIVVVGQLSVDLADYDIATPSAPIVASVEDTAILELSVIFGR